MHPTRCLRDEHQVILRVLNFFADALDDATEANRVTRERFGPFVEFFQGFADRCHHCKEEDRLFPTLERCGIPREGGPIGVMLHEHQLAREHVRAIAEHLAAADAGDATAVETVLGHGRDYLDLLRAHISKEDRVLFEMADSMVQGEELRNLDQAYEQARSEGPYCATLSRCMGIVDDLARGQPHRPT